MIGLNVNSGQRICLRLRHPGDRSQFLPIEQVVDTMLHELSHNVHGPHDAKFHALWNQLREEYEALIRKGYTGEGFLSTGRRLGGRRIPPEEARRIARASAEKRRTLSKGSGQKLGGAAPQPGQDRRAILADATERRNKTLRGCANDNQTQDEIREIADTATRNGFKTQAEEDAANEAAIAQALWELVQEDEKAKKGDSYIPPSTSNQKTPEPLQQASSSRQADRNSRKGVEQSTAPVALTVWTCEICTLENPVSFLCCDACGTERGDKISQSIAGRSAKREPTVIDLTQSPPSKGGSRSAAVLDAQSTLSTAPTRPPTWTCSFCGRKRERQWWSCDICGTIKQDSK